MDFLFQFIVSLVEWIVLKLTVRWLFVILIVFITVFFLRG